MCNAVGCLHRKKNIHMVCQIIAELRYIISMYQRFVIKKSRFYCTYYTGCPNKDLTIHFTFCLVQHVLE